MGATCFCGSEIGGEGRKVDEHRAVIIFDLGAYPEPKALSQIELEKLLLVHKTTSDLARFLETSFSNVQSRLKPNRKWDPKKKKFVKLKRPKI